jgi:hypothetical protein
MHPHNLIRTLLFCLIFTTPIVGQKQKAPTGGRVAIVVDERLAALRATPQLNGKLIRRIGLGRLVAIRSAKRDQDGIVFYLVNLTTRTHGWIQREAVVSPLHEDDAHRLLDLIKNSADFDRISRARIFLDHFPRSPYRPEVLLILADAAEEASVKLSRDASRRVVRPTVAPEFSYFLNYTGLDRYNRLGVRFVFDSKSKRFHYDGTAWREIVRHYPRAREVVQARERLELLNQ